MVDTVGEATPDPAQTEPRRPTTWADRVRYVLRGVGQTLISAGVVVLLFVVYEVYVTNYFAERAQAKVQSTVHEQWTKVATDPARPDPLLPLPNGTLPKLPDGTGIAFLYIPRLGRDYSWAIVEGTSDADLEKGPGHYLRTALPGQRGNFAVAGHRVGKGEPFLNLDQLRAGDAVIVQTESRWFVYRVNGRDHHDVTSRDADGIPGREIVDPGNGSVLDEVPDHPGVVATRGQRYLTLTTCHPKFTAEHRMVVHAALDPSQTMPATTNQRMPGAIAALYNLQGP